MRLSQFTVYFNYHFTSLYYVSLLGIRTYVSANNIIHFKMPTSSLRSKICLADFRNQHCKRNSVFCLWSHQVEQYQEQHNAVYEIRIAWSFTVSLRVSRQLPIVLIQQLHQCNRLQRFCCGCDVNSCELLRILKIWQHWWSQLTVCSNNRRLVLICITCIIVCANCHCHVDQEVSLHRY